MRSLSLMHERKREMLLSFCCRDDLRAAAKRAGAFSIDFTHFKAGKFMQIRRGRRHSRAATRGHVHIKHTQLLGSYTHAAVQKAAAVVPRASAARAS